MPSEIKGGRGSTTTGGAIHVRRERQGFERKGRAALSRSTKWITHSGNHAGGRWRVGHQLSIDRRMIRAVRARGKLAAAGRECEELIMHCGLDRSSNRVSRESDIPKHIQSDPVASKK